MTLESRHVILSGRRLHRSNPTLGRRLELSILFYPPRVYSIRISRYSSKLIVHIYIYCKISIRLDLDFLNTVYSLGFDIYIYVCIYIYPGSSSPPNFAHWS